MRWHQIINEYQSPTSDQAYLYHGTSKRYLDVKPDPEENGFFIDRVVPPEQIEFWNGKTWMNITKIIHPKNINEYQSPLSNPAFKTWFGNSKVVDSHGNPQRVYHGTGNNFNTFTSDIGGAGSSGAREGGLGFWFTDNTETASDFADWSARGIGANVIPVYLKIQHPWIVHKYADIRDLMDRHTKFERPSYKLGDSNIRMVNDKIDYRAARQELIDNGYDGIILPNTLTDSPDQKTPITQYVALYSNQMKSAIGNKGTYNDYEPSITEEAVPNKTPNFAAIVSNPQFQNWFSGSKIIDRKGNPLPVFHGTISNFSRFDPDKANSKSGTGVPRGVFVFSTSPKIAASYAGQHTWMTGSKEWREGGNIIPVFLNINKPLKIDARGDDWNNIRFRDDDWDINRIMGYAQRKGYDGLVVKNVLDSGEGYMDDSKATTIVAFNPYQIKSIFSKEFKDNSEISEEIL